MNLARCRCDGGHSFIFGVCVRPVCLSVCLSVCLRVCLCVYVSICLPVCGSLSLSLCLSVCLSVCPLVLPAGADLLLEDPRRVGINDVGGVRHLLRIQTHREPRVSRAGDGYARCAYREGVVVMAVVI